MGRCAGDLIGKSGASLRLPLLYVSKFGASLVIDKYTLSRSSPLLAGNGTATPTTSHTDPHRVQTADRRQSPIKSPAHEVIFATFFLPWL